MRANEWENAQHVNAGDMKYRPPRQHHSNITQTTLICGEKYGVDVDFELVWTEARW